MSKTIPLSRFDNFFLQTESRAMPMHTASLNIYKIPRDAPADYMRRLFQELMSFPVSAAPFTYRLATNSKGKPVWEVDPHLDMEYHLRHSALPRDGGERELGTLVSRLHSHQLDLGRPLWEFHVIEGLANNRFATYMKMHHSLADGGAVVKILSDSMSFDPNAKSLPPPWARADRPPTSQATGPSAKPRRADPAEEDKRYTSLLSALMKTARVAWKKSDSGLVMFTSAPRSILNNRVSPARRYATQTVKLERMKAVGSAADGTVNDVMLAMCAAALRRYLVEQNALPKRALIAHVPVGLGREDDDELGNQVASIAVSLATTIADPILRFEAIRESAESGKALLLGMRKKTIDIYRAIVIVPLMISQLPRKSDARRTRQRRPLGGNLIISNVPGPRTKLYFRGAEVEALYPCSVLAGSCGLNITARGYHDRINFGVIGCPDSLPSLQHIAIYLGEALAELETAYGIATLAEAASTG